MFAYRGLARPRAHILRALQTASPILLTYKDEQVSVETVAELAGHCARQSLDLQQAATWRFLNRSSLHQHENA
jgi:hypothetical protein